MTDIANLEQFASWNGNNGQRWVANADRQDRVLAPVADALLGRASVMAGEHLIDVGCGCGATTLTAAGLVGDGGTATGIDSSAPMLKLARRRAAGLSADNVTFIQGDAQAHHLRTGIGRPDPQPLRDHVLRRPRSRVPQSRGRSASRSTQPSTTP